MSRLGAKNWVASGTQSVTVTGLAFWNTDYTASAQVTDVMCTTTSWSSSTKVACMTLVMIQSPVYSRVTVGSVTSTAVGTFSYDGE